MQQKILFRRLIAYLVDFSIITFFWLAISTSLVSFFVSLNGHMLTPPPMSFEQSFVWALTAVFPLIFVGYFTSCYYMGNGQTIGKLFLNISINQKEMSFQKSLFRASLQFLSYITLSIPNLMAFFHNSSESLIDKWTQTHHYKVEPNELMANVQEDNLIEMFPDSSKEFESILEDEIEKAS